MLADLRYGIYSELNESPMDVDLYRRNLQRTYIDMLGSLIEDPSANSDLPALARAELVALGSSLENCDSEAADNETVRAHLQDLHARIKAALDHRATRSTAPSAAAPTGRRRAVDRVSLMAEQHNSPTCTRSLWRRLAATSSWRNA